MGFASELLAWSCIGPVILALCGPSLLFAQERPAERHPGKASVPFIGCKSDGQTGPLDAPKGNRISLPIDTKAAKQLAYYKSELGLGVLAPRGWYCFGTYGSGGIALLVNSQPFDVADLFSANSKRLSGPAVILSQHSGDTSGRFEVAALIARIFPHYLPFATRVIEDYELQDPLPIGPYPKDRVIYKSQSAVEYQTPADTEGLGTTSWLEKDQTPIDGVAMLIGDTPDSLLLYIRLPLNVSRLRPEIARQLEREAAPVKK